MLEGGRRGSFWRRRLRKPACDHFVSLLLLITTVMLLLQLVPLNPPFSLHLNVTA